MTVLLSAFVIFRCYWDFTKRFYSSIYSASTSKVSLYFKQSLLSLIYVQFFLWTTKNWHMYCMQRLNWAFLCRNLAGDERRRSKTRKQNLKPMLLKEVLFTNILLITACTLIIMKYKYGSVHVFFCSSAAVLNDSDLCHRLKLFLVEVCIGFEFLCESSQKHSNTQRLNWTKPSVVKTINTAVKTHFNFVVRLHKISTTCFQIAL